MASDIRAWADYGLAIVGGAAALTGLLFVAVSVTARGARITNNRRGALTMTRRSLTRSDD
jgi:hypothetical protein